jgi:hypothetical protein
MELKLNPKHACGSVERVARIKRQAICADAKTVTVEELGSNPSFLDRTTGRTRDDIDALRRELLRRQPLVETAKSSRQESSLRELRILDCLACGRSFCACDGGFCSIRCRAAYDVGWPVYEPPVIRYGMPKGRHGFLIDCAGCHKQFDSKGLRCCSPDCEQRYQHKQKLEADLAGAAFRVVKRKCAAFGCRVEIPNWRNGRLVRARFCSPRCQKRTVRSAIGHPDSPQPLLSAKQAKKCPETGPSRQALEGSSVASKAARAPAKGREQPRGGIDKRRVTLPTARPRPTGRSSAAARATE